MADAHAQAGFAVRFGWGPDATRTYAASGVGVLVVVDVLRFTTAVDVAVARGIGVEPRTWDDQAEEHRWALSPSAILEAPPTPRLIVPSPNGAHVATIAARGDAVVLAGCLRNARAVARAARAVAGSTIGVVAAGERWPEGGLRPAVEDLIGAGAVLAELMASGAGPASPEARVATAAHHSVADSLEEALLDCVSGRELVARGLDADVRLAAEADVSDAVPILRDGAFVNLDHSGN